MDMKDDSEMAAQLALSLSSAVGGGHHSWAQGGPLSAPQAHTSMLTSSADTQHLTAPPPAHAHTTSSNLKPLEAFLDKSLLEAAANYLISKEASLSSLASHNSHSSHAAHTSHTSHMTHPMKTESPGAHSQSPSDSGSGSLPWALQQQTLLQQYGHLMLEKMMSKQQTETLSHVNTASATITSDAETYPQSLVATSANHVSVPVKSEVVTETADAQRDAYRRMLNYSMSSSLAQQYYLSQYGYNYMQADNAAATSTTSSGHSSNGSHSSMSAATSDIGSQLPSIDSVLLNLSTKKTNGKAMPASTSAHVDHGAHHHMKPIVSHHHHHHHQMQHSVHSVPAYGLQALANAAIGVDSKYDDLDHSDHRKDSLKADLEEVTDTDSSNMSPSDSHSGAIMSPSRTSFSHLLDVNPHISIPAAHSHQLSSLYQTKSSIGTLPSIQHFSAIGKSSQISPKHGDHSLPLQLSSHGGFKPSDLIAAAMKLKVESTEEKEIADRTIQEKIAAHQLNHAVQQQAHELAASALAASNMDTAAILAKLQASNLESELHRLYESEAMQALQHEPMELTSDLSPGKAGSRRKSRGRPTSIESLRDPLGRQTSTSSSIGANTTASMDNDDRTFDCEICGKQFSHNDRLRRHRKIHTSDKPYKCDICGKGFKEKCNLKHHRFIHTGEKPYKCDTCGKSFNQRSSLKTHQKVHTGEKPFKCDLCDKPFAQKYLLRQHMKKHIEMNMGGDHPTSQHQ